MGKILLILYIPFLNKLQDAYHNDIIKIPPERRCYIGGVVLYTLGYLACPSYCRPSSNYLQLLAQQ